MPQRNGKDVFNSAQQTREWSDHDAFVPPLSRDTPGNQLYYGAVRNQRQRETDAKPSEYPICFRGAQSTPVVTANTLWDAGRSWKQSVPQDEKLRELNIPL